MSIDIQAVLTKHGITMDLGAIAADPSPIYALAWKLDKAIKAAKSAPVASTSATHPYDAKAEKDSKAKATAVTLIDAFIRSFNKAVEANPHVAFHVANEAKSIARLANSDVEYFRWTINETLSAEAKAKLVTSNTEVAEWRQDRSDVVEFLRMLESSGFVKVDSLPLWKDGDSFDSLSVVLNKNDKRVINLPSLRGRGDSSSPAGRNAGLSYYEWNIGDKGFPIGTHANVLIRSLYKGRDRLDKKGSDLYKLIAEHNGGNQDLDEGKRLSFEYEGTKVMVRRISKAEYVAAGSTEDDDTEDDD